ncbi:hypothetical protein K469DRAFT_564290 [Zopfia rhizophila CBS 207.26]|uniref:Ribosome biogenesis protein Alb1 n=1 Tax=Zopfia rhizophila CBS 207.26 TaxID=1314779 RepID=A0A6A6ECX8_9PEZI|nr:hypothetical protein K469DRAFT_564290 [Zopfia rhizophila CBS 207.26]
MAKVAKYKKKQAALHSRAARRAVSPSIDLDKSLKCARADSPSNASAKLHIVAAQSAGITKKLKSKPLKRAQRLRQIKGMEKWADAQDKLEVRVQRSAGKEKKVRERRKAWDEVNGEKKKARNAFEVLEEEGAAHRDRGWVSDEEMPEVDRGLGDDGLEAEVTGEVKELVVPASVPLPVVTAEEEELL